MSPDPMPRKNGFVEVEEMDNESLLYRRPSKTASYLNETATVIWKLCDGTRSTDDIIAVLSQSFPEDAEQIRADVKATVDQLIQAGALRMAEPGDGVAGTNVEIEEETD